MNGWQRNATRIAFAFTVVACATADESKRAHFPTGVLLLGQVMYPDGSPAAGAKVVAETTCTDSTIHMVDDTVTDSDGSFAFTTFDSSCGRYRFTAEKRETFWLKTGKEVFYPQLNGTAPEIQLVDSTPPEPVLIQFGLRGAELEIAVWDEFTSRRIRAGLDVECPEAWCGAMGIATGKDGEPHTVFVPARRYRVTLNSYPCGAKKYFADGGPSITVDAIEGQRRSVELRINTRLVRAQSSYDNVKGAACLP